jgi:hypothetical protein
MQEHSPQIFISYANPDQARVIPYFEALETKGFNVWLDCRKLKPGQNWDFEVKRAFDKSGLVIAFISEASVGRRGYVQRELKLALDKLNEKLIDDIYIIPIMLDEDVPIPEQLKGIQCISAHAADCLLRVEDALMTQLGRLGLQVQRIQQQKEVAWSFQTIREEWDGLPGYEVELQLINFHSARYASVPEIGHFIRADLLKSLFSARANKLAQSPEQFNYGQDKFFRTNTIDAHCGEPTIVGKMLTVQYAIHEYWAGAAHGNIGFATYCFVLEPLFLIERLQSIFEADDKALAAIQTSVRNQLKATSVGDDADNFLDEEWVDRGTRDWNDFKTYIAKDEGIEFLFPPYQVAAYACGPQFALVPYEEVVDFMRNEYQSSFGINGIAYRRKHEREGNVA